MMSRDKSERIAACPQCGASTRLDPGNPWRPFCCERCKLIDLGDWLSGRYAVPVEQGADGPDQDDGESDQ
jgi:endogenous inhibitor of DNA gyrase (YacG/DUF329 family)